MIYRVLLFLFLTLLPVVMVIGFSYLNAPSLVDSDGYREVTWRDLKAFDHESAQAPDELKDLVGEKVRIPGFVVPLDDDIESYSEFLLVPTAKACVHVPPPPPNQMIFVRMKSGEAPKREWGPVWIRGIFRVQDTQSGFGKVSFLVLGESAEKYQVTR
jgi:uncharacterized protein